MFRRIVLAAFAAIIAGCTVGDQNCPAGQTWFFCHIQFQPPAYCACGTQFTHSWQCGLSEFQTAEDLREYLAGMYPDVRVSCVRPANGAPGGPLSEPLEFCDPTYESCGCPC